MTEDNSRKERPGSLWDRIRQVDENLPDSVDVFGAINELANHGLEGRRMASKAGLILQEHSKAWGDYRDMILSRGYVSMGDAWAVNALEKTKTPETPRGDFREVYNLAVRMILEEWGWEQWRNRHVPAPGPDTPGFKETSQVCVPGIYFPPGHYDAYGSWVVHPKIPVTLAPGDSARLWFWQKEGGAADGWLKEYFDDETEWFPDVPNGNSFGTVGCVVIPHGIEWEIPLGDAAYEDQTWTGRDVVLLNACIQSDLDWPTTGVLCFGSQTNMRLSFHYLPQKHRDKSWGFNQVPGNEFREVFGTKDPKAPQARVVPSEVTRNGRTFCETHLADCDIDAFVEFCRGGVVFTGWGNRVNVREYYGLLGAYLYGSGEQKEGNILTVYADRDGVKDRAHEVIDLIDRPGTAVLQNGVKGPRVWIRRGTAPADGAGFSSGDKLF